MRLSRGGTGKPCNNGTAARHRQGVPACASTPPYGQSMTGYVFHTRPCPTPDHLPPAAATPEMVWLASAGARQHKVQSGAVQSRHRLPEELEYGCRWSTGQRLWERRWGK